MRKAIAVIVLLLAQVSFVYAGEMMCGITSPDTTSPTSGTTTSSATVTELVLVEIISVVVTQ